MWASAGMVMKNTKGLALQSSSPSHKVWRRRKTTHAGVKHHGFCHCPRMKHTLIECRINRSNGSLVGVIKASCVGALKETRNKKQEINKK